LKLYQSCLKIQVLIEGKKPQNSNMTGISPGNLVDIVAPSSPPIDGDWKKGLAILKGFLKQGNVKALKKSI